MNSRHEIAHLDQKAWQDTAEECRRICANLRAYSARRTALIRQLNTQADDFRRSLEAHYREADAAETNVKKELAKIVSGLARLGRGGNPIAIARSIYKAIGEANRLADSFPQISNTLTARDKAVGETLKKIDVVDAYIRAAESEQNKNGCRC